MSDRVNVICPCCDTRLVVETTSGEILSEERPQRDAGKSFQDALQKVQGGSQRREDAFNKAFDRTKHLDDLLGKKFEEAKKKAAEQGDEKPVNPMDLD